MSGTSLGQCVRRDEEPDLFMLRRWESNAKIVVTEICRRMRMKAKHAEP